MVHPRLQDQRSHGITTGARRATASRVNVTSTLGHDARMTVWIDTHCHLDAPEFSADVAAVRARAAAKNVAVCVVPPVVGSALAGVRGLAHRRGGAYAPG